MNKPKAVIFDLDGTLANIDHRLHHFKGEGATDWDAFFAGIPEDKVNKWCHELILIVGRNNSDGLYMGGSDFTVRVLLVTCRPERVRGLTTAWLKGKWIKYSELLCREEGDRRPDYLVKEEILHEQILPRYEVLFAVDDRQSVVDMWRRNGITCLQCAKGDY